MISASITSPARAGVKLHFPYPTGAHADDACNWDANNKHTTDIVFENAQSAVLKRTLDSTVYYVSLRWEGKASLKEKSANYFVLTPTEDKLAFLASLRPLFPELYSRVNRLSIHLPILCLLSPKLWQPATAIGTISGRMVRL